MYAPIPIGVGITEMALYISPRFYCNIPENCTYLSASLGLFSIAPTMLPVSRTPRDASISSHRFQSMSGA
jgi:hypothetical protein